ncbi:RagB/SusD family nutrient uptake outer membrane protein [Marinilabiliaceae bacterium JC017]|nr:RagB/SusD family nutrient uptake outer membrane protein [Marinilabiliaceae bacterium JC017]
MEIIRVYKIWIIIACLALGFSCSEDFMDKSPYASITNENALGSYDKLVQSTKGLYPGLMGSNLYGQRMIIAPDVLADNIKFSNEATTSRYNQDYLLNLTDQNSPWTFSDAYYLITASCNIINAIDKGEFDRQTATDDQINQILGEALFMRALGHFTSVNFYAHHYTIEDANVAPGADGNGGHLGIPIVLETQIGEPARNTVKEVYDQVINDLTRSVSLLNEKKAVYYVSPNVAKAFLARVYLYKEDYENAAKMANDVIQSGDYMLTPKDGYENYWKLADQPETIFEVAMDFSDPDFEAGNNTVGGVYLYYKDVVSTDQLANLYEDNDVRKLVLKPNGSGEYLIYKYPGREGTDGVQVNNTKVIRLAEMYLIRAEGNEKAGTTIGDTPFNDINFLRQERGLDELSVVDAAAIALERRLELAYEGFRIYDLARYKADNVRPECLPVPLVKYPDSRYVYKVPMHEVDNNVNMVQNP